MLSLQGSYWTVPEVDVELVVVHLCSVFLALKVLLARSDELSVMNKRTNFRKCLLWSLHLFLLPPGPTLRLDRGLSKLHHELLLTERFESDFEDFDFRFHCRFVLKMINSCLTNDWISWNICNFTASSAIAIFRVTYLTRSVSPSFGTKSLKVR